MFKQYADRLTPYVPTLLRIVVGAVFLAHGLQKIDNPDGVIGFMEFLEIPAPTAAGWLLTILEPVGGVLLIIGLGTRYLGILFSIEMLVATFIHKMPNVGFIGPSDAPGTGYELDLLLLAGSLILIVLGSGALSVEQNVLKREYGPIAVDVEAA